MRCSAARGTETDVGPAIPVLGAEQSSAQNCDLLKVPLEKDSRLEPSHNYSAVALPSSAGPFLTKPQMKPPEDSRASFL